MLTLETRPDAIDDPSDHRVGASVPAGLLGALALILVACSAFFAWSLPAAVSRRGRPTAELAEGTPGWHWLFDHAGPPASSGALGLAVATAIVLFVGSWAGIVMVTRRRGTSMSVRWVLGLVAVAIAVSTLALPNKTSDVYDYVVFGRVESVHGGDAYHDVPDQYPGDPIYPYVSRRYTGRPDNKLPAWTAVTIAVTSVTGDGPVVNLFAFRLLLGGATVATAAMIGWILRRIRPSAAASGVAMFGLNPVTIIYGPEKTDALMALLVVVGLALVVAGRRHLATAAIAVSVLVKLITAPVLVLVMVLPLPGVGWRSGSARGRSSPRLGWGSVATRLAVAVAVAVAFYGPFRDPVDLLRSHLSGADRATVIPGFHTVALGACALGLLVIVAASWRRHEIKAHTDTRAAEVLFESAALVLVVFSVLLTRPGLPWYLISALAVASLARSRAWFVVLAMLSATSLLMGTWDAVGTAAHPLPSLRVDRSVIYLGGAMVAAVVLAAVELRRRTRAGAEAPRPVDATSAVSVGGHRQKSPVAKLAADRSERCSGGRPAEHDVVMDPDR